MTGDNRINTDFITNQAIESHIPFYKQKSVMILMAIFAAAILYGIYSLIVFVVNFDKNSVMQYVSIQLQKPTQKEGCAYVDALISNYNPRMVEDVTFKFNVAGSDGATLASGNIDLYGQIPAGESRTFPNVKLAQIAGSAARMHGELSDLKLGDKPTIDSFLKDRFIEAAQMKPEESLSAWIDFVKSAPGFVPGYIKLGQAYVADHNFDQAINAFKQAVNIDKNNAEGHYQLATAYFYKGDRKFAKEELEKAVKLAPDDELIKTGMKQLGNGKKLGEDSNSPTDESADQ